MPFTIVQGQGRVPVTVLELAGRINMSNAAELETQIQALYQRGTRHLLIDLTQLESITSAGLRVILAGIKLFGDGGAPGKATNVKLANPSPNIHQVFKIAGFEDIAEIYHDRQQAVDSF